MLQGEEHYGVATITQDCGGCNQAFIQLLPQPESLTSARLHVALSSVSRYAVLMGKHV
jgi:hypothetical protein